MFSQGDLSIYFKNWSSSELKIQIWRLQEITKKKEKREREKHNTHLRLLIIGKHCPEFYRRENCHILSLLPQKDKFSTLSSLGSDSQLFEMHTSKEITLAVQPKGKKLKTHFVNKLLLDLFPESLVQNLVHSLQKIISRMNEDLKRLLHK